MIDRVQSRWWLGMLPLMVACSGESAPDEQARVVVPVDAGGVDSEPFDPDAACATSTIAAQQVQVSQQVEVQVPYQVPAPVALYVLLDRSLSMGWNGIWKPAGSAIEAFAADPGSSGIDMALNYFPATSGACASTAFATPAVTLGSLPSNATNLAASLAKTSATGTGMPMEGALSGAIGYCKAFELQHPGEDCIVVLVTDGKLDFTIGCSSSAANVASIAKAGFEDATSVRTFTVGLSGADFTVLDAIARAGGAADCDPSSKFSCDITTGTEKLSAALSTIRSTVTKYQTELRTETRSELRPLACTWTMPVPAPGNDLVVDPTKVNVTAHGGGRDQTLGKVSASSACGPGGWYFDDPGRPTQIIACPETCAALDAARASDVQIQLGCETQVLVI